MSRQDTNVGLDPRILGVSSTPADPNDLFISRRSLKELETRNIRPQTFKRKVQSEIQDGNTLERKVKRNSQGQNKLSFQGRGGPQSKRQYPKNRFSGRREGNQGKNNRERGNGGERGNGRNNRGRGDNKRGDGRNERGKDNKRREKDNNKREKNDEKRKVLSNQLSICIA